MATRPRKSLSVRTRFEVFKRDSFTCRYCGRTTPDCVLEIDHIVPVSEGGGNDPMNLATSCWQCNSGKKATPLASVMTGEDPHDKALGLLETERQLKEYNVVLAKVRKRQDKEAQELLHYWCSEVGATGVPKNQFAWMRNQLRYTPRETIRSAMDTAIRNNATAGWRYVMAVVKNWREDAAKGAA